MQTFESSLFRSTVGHGTGAQTIDRWDDALSTICFRRLAQVAVTRDASKDSERERERERERVLVCACIRLIHTQCASACAYNTKHVRIVFFSHALTCEQHKRNVAR